MSERPPERTGLLLPLASTEPAVRLAAVLGLAADAVPAGRGVLLLPRAGDSAGGGADDSAGGGGGDGVVDDALATRVSRALRRGDVLVLRLADEQVAVQRWRAGRLVDTPHYGAVGGLDGDAERVLLGHLPAAQARGAASTDGVDRREAVRSTVAAVRGPVRPWQLVLSAVGLVASLLLGASAVLDALGPEGGVVDVVRALVWALLALYWARSLRGLLRRRAEERAAGAGPRTLEP